MSSSDESDDDIFAVDIRKSQARGVPTSLSSPAAAPAGAGPRGSRAPGARGKAPDEGDGGGWQPRASARAGRVVISGNTREHAEELERRQTEDAKPSERNLDMMYSMGVRDEHLFWCNAPCFPAPWPCRIVRDSELIGNPALFRRAKADPALRCVEFFSDEGRQAAWNTVEAQRLKPYFKPWGARDEDGESDRGRWHERTLENKLQYRCKTAKEKKVFRIAMAVAQHVLEGLRDRETREAIAASSGSGEAVTLESAADDAPQDTASGVAVPQSSADAPAVERLRAGDRVFFWSPIFPMGDARGRREERVLEIFRHMDGAMRCKTETELLGGDEVMLRLSTRAEDGTDAAVPAKWRKLNEYDLSAGKIEGFETSLAREARAAIDEVRRAAAAEAPELGDMLQGGWRGATAGPASKKARVDGDA